MGIGYAAIHWLVRAEISHETTTLHNNSINQLSEIVSNMNEQQNFERKLWGEDYEKRISKILEKEAKLKKLEDRARSFDQ